MAALALHFVLSRPSRREWMALVGAVGLTFILVLPWAIYLQTWARGRFAFDVYRFVGHLAHYAVYLTGWAFPVPLLLIFGWLYLRHWRPQSWLRLGSGEGSIWMYFSYIVQLVPLAAALLALTVAKVLDRGRALGLALLVVLVTSNLLHLFPYVLPVARQFRWASLAPRPYLAETDALISMAGQLRSDLFDYAYELTHDYDDPN
jgi:hypothetical protein